MGRLRGMTRTILKRMQWLSVTSGLVQVTARHGLLLVTRDGVGGAAYACAVATLDELRRAARGLPGSEERATTGGAAWFVRRKLYAWECHPWPSIPAEIRAIIAAELVVGVKVADRLDALALVEMAPDVFLRTTTSWGEPKIAFRMAGIDGSISPNS